MSEIMDEVLGKCTYMLKETVLVTGGNSQLARCIKDIVDRLKSESYEYIFVNHDELDITSDKSIEACMSKYDPQHVINCASYTNVEKAEDEGWQESIAVNWMGVTRLSNYCSKNNIQLIHISTDYVFDGENNMPYTEDDIPKPINRYGMSKWMGEYQVQDEAMVIRTSWLYSEYGNNFFKTMYKRIQKGTATKVVNDQIGTPTYAKDLAFFIYRVIEDDKYKTGIYQFSNDGSASWYDFAHAIEVLYNESVIDNYPYITPCTSEEFKQKANRPKYSVMSKNKVKKEFGDEFVRHWFDALSDCVKHYFEMNSK